MNRKIAVIGGAGRLGRYIVNELASVHDVLTLDRNPQSAIGKAEAVDILSIDRLRAVFAGLDAIVHVAGIDGHVETSPENFFGTNVLGTWNVLQAAFEAGIRQIVVTSSSSVTGINGEPGAARPDYVPIDEKHPIRPATTYGLSKRLNETTAAHFGSLPDMQVICIRPSFVAFPELVPHLAGLPIEFDGEIPAAFREPRPFLRTYVDPRDLARCYRLALDFDENGFHLFWANAGDTFETTPSLDYLRRHYSTMPEIRDPARYGADSHAALIDSSRAATVLGWRPEFTWSRILDEWRAQQR